MLMVADFGLWFVDCLSLGLCVAAVCLLAVVVVVLLGFVLTVALMWGVVV